MIFLVRERKTGEYLSGMEKQQPGEHREKKRSPNSILTPTLSELGISKDQSSRWQKKGGSNEIQTLIPLRPFRTLTQR